MYIQIKHKLPLWAFQPELVFTGLKKHLLFTGLLNLAFLSAMAA